MANHVLKSFSDLKQVIDMNRREDCAQRPSGPPPVEVDDEDPTDEMLFHREMADVVPLSKKNVYQDDAKKPDIPENRLSEEMETSDKEWVDKLRALVEHGEGFRIADTDEYVEGMGYRSHPHFMGRLHQGTYAVQDYIDLHGMGMEEARTEVNAFLKNAIRLGKRCVLIVHGRGLSSPCKPVLKLGILKLLKSNYWRKWILAFASARLCDGGAGGTYVLLRRRPVSGK